MKPSKRYSRDADVMMEFRNAYVRLVNCAQLREGELFLPVLGPAPGVSRQEWGDLRSAAAHAAGAAGHVYARYGGTLSMRNAAYLMTGVNPVANWELSLRDPEQLRPESLIAAVEGAMARARQEAAEAEDREKGFTGLVAAFLRWPSDLRDAVGPGKAQRTAAGVVGVFGQVIVATLGGALAVGVAAGAAELWQSAF